MPQHKGSLIVLYGAATLAALGGFIIGFDTGAISGILAMPQFNEAFPGITSAQQGFLVSTILFTSFVGCLISGWLADIFSRKRSIIFGALLFAVGAALETVGITIVVLFVARAVAGFGAGIMSNVIPMCKFINFF
ncbi:hypothetical protein BC938DRAFT_474113 [Jimgerdemannia flammicorona]|uniref:Major facilitator superfamily (MFS) profile domain-containing protein n=1 Tax=Jimgerdemannia flammicorona TaxID=994334 RepID=A0A433QSV7_9FUNG|nr:hypothetical protein BC938DRAFT_474113 [Jimgerdemannia flammicorona]